MRHVINLAIKFVMLAIVLGIFLPSFTPVSLGLAIAVAAILTVGAYVVGDLLILPAAGNLIATFADAGMAALVVWGAQYLMAGFIVDWLSAIIIGVFVGGGEWFYHNYLKASLRIG